METRWTTRWWLSLTFLFGYVGVFGIWTLWTQREAVIVSTIMVVALGLVVVYRGVRRHYFFNRSETFAYACIIVDVIAESVLLLRLIEGEPVPPKPVFWLCTVAFAAVLGGYRFWKIKRGMGKTATQH